MACPLATRHTDAALRRLNSNMSKALARPSKTLQFFGKASMAATSAHSVSQEQAFAASAPAVTKPPAPTAAVRVDTGESIVQLQVPVLALSSSVLSVSLQMPMGIVLEECKSDGLVRVVEVSPGSSAAKKNVREGDILRALTAASMQMTYPTVNLMLGGVGRPKLQRVAVQVTGKPFAWVKEAIRSNLQLGSDITLVLERPGQLPRAVASQEEAGYEDEPAGGPEWDAGSVFDPRIFD